MKEKGKSLFILVAVVSVVLCACSYYMVLKPDKAKAASIEAENEQLQQRVDTLEVYKRNENEYRAQIKKNLETVAAILEEYPADVRYEDAIMEAVKMQENNHRLRFTTLTVNDKQEVLTVSDETVQKMNRNEYVSAVGFELREATYNSELCYPELKNALKQILEKDSRVAICSVDFQNGGEWYTYGKLDDSEDWYLLAVNPLLAGQFTIDWYSVTGTDKEYVAPDMSEYESGVENIFGTIKVEIDEETGLPIMEVPQN